MNFAGTTKDTAVRHGSAGSSARDALGGAGSDQWESSAEQHAGPRSNITAPKLRGSAHPSIGRHGSADLHGAPANFSGSTGAHRGGARTGRTDPLSVAGDCLPHRP